jgi:hypothetical protein
VRFNINDYVRVKLTDLGRNVIANYTAEFQVRHNIALTHWPKDDAEGWSKWQAHDLISTFGEHLGPGFGDVPFETTIEIPDEYLKPNPNPMNTQETTAPTEQSGELAIVEGGFYRNRKGEKIGPMRPNMNAQKQPHKYPWATGIYGDIEYFQANGSWHWGTEQTALDLIAPWPAEAPAPSAYPQSVDIVRHERDELNKANVSLRTTLAAAGDELADLRRRVAELEAELGAEKNRLEFVGKTLSDVRAKRSISYIDETDRPNLIDAIRGQNEKIKSLTAERDALAEQLAGAKAGIDQRDNALMRISNIAQNNTTNGYVDMDS